MAEAETHWIGKVHKGQGHESNEVVPEDHVRADPQGQAEKGIGIEVRACRARGVEGLIRAYPVGPAKPKDVICGVENRPSGVKRDSTSQRYLGGFFRPCNTSFPQSLHQAVKTDPVGVGDDSRGKIGRR
ncbi:hypothetical protein N7492_005617 [Penicillium capsulatum]|uniref:Uncharacterized protein n=1 Tax=Penicillium capsulatum TaxID=69766 RepID=A0A9W9I9Q2_9EURO|nr:hypothetical protein N7492_005617 [Penicillium capsulatum]